MNAFNGLKSTNINAPTIIPALRDTRTRRVAIAKMIASNAGIIE
jgi:hypothetical protein